MALSKSTPRNWAIAGRTGPDRSMTPILVAAYDAAEGRWTVSAVMPDNELVAGGAASLPTALENLAWVLRQREEDE